MPPIRPLAAMAALALAACAPPSGDTPSYPMPPAEDTCGAAAFQTLVGQDVAPVLATTFTQPIRIIRPDDMVTMDFQPQRLNFRLDANDVVRAVDCG